VLSGPVVCVVVWLGRVLCGHGMVLFGLVRIFLESKIYYSGVGLLRSGSLGYGVAG